jgi:hypothetical protein
MRRQLWRESVPLGVALVVLALWLLWIGASGGYAQTVWYPSALGLISLWVLTLVRSRRVLPEAMPARVALLAFAALVGLNYLSIAWAGSPGSALDSSNQLALYLLGAWVFALLPWTPRRLAALAGAWSVGVCVFCAVDLARAVSASSLTIFFVDGRFATPMQYSNATGALGVMGMWPTLILSSRRELPAWLRACCLGIATFLATFAVLPQSRASLLGLLLTAPLALIVMSDRLRLLCRMLVVGGALALCLPLVVHVNDAVSAGAQVTPVLRHAARAMLVSAVGGALIGLCLGLVENRVSARRANARRANVRQADGQAQPSRSHGLPRVPPVLAAVLVAVILVSAAVVLEPRIAHLVHETVRKGNTDAGTGSNRFLSTSPEERFDYARVALHLFSGSPVLGIGSGNFGRRYDALRRFQKHSQYTHNLPLRVLSETGLVGTLLFFVLVVALVVGMIRVARRHRDLSRACVGMAFTVTGYFLVHSCLDWVDVFPALAVPAIALPMAAITLGDTPPARDAPTGAEVRRSARSAKSRARVGWAVLGVGGAGLFVAMASAYLSLQSTNRAFAIFRADPQQAYHYLRLAKSLNPLSATPITSEGTIALYAGDTNRAISSFTASVRKEDDWYPRLELALIDARVGRFPAALTQVDAAARLDVEDPLITQARQQIVRHRRVDPIAFNREVEQEGNSTASTQKPVR